MRILIYLSHPAQFLFYKNPVTRLRQNGHSLFILTKTKDVLTNLLDEAGWEYNNILPQTRGKSRFSILWGLLRRCIKILNFARENKVGLLLGTDASLAHVGKLLGIPCVTTLEDDYEIIKNLANLTYPFTSHILVPEVCSVGKWERKKIGYNGYMKLAYLHPDYFVPDQFKVPINSNQSFFLIRLSGLTAHHDIGINGIRNEFLDRIIEIVKGYGTIYISSEKPVPEKYKSHRLNIPISDIHHYLFYSTLLICDSQSMAMEAAMLGTPSIRISDFAGRISVLEELEHSYGLTFGFKPTTEEAILLKINELLLTPRLKEEFQNRRQKMLSEKINVTAFLVWFIENYPESFKVMKEDPDYQNRFR